MGLGCGGGGGCCPCRVILLSNTPCGVGLQLDIYQTPPFFRSLANSCCYTAVYWGYSVTLCLQYCVRSEDKGDLAIHVGCLFS